MTEQTAILVVDDNPPMANTLADILSMKGYDARVAYSGAEALDVLRTQKIHVMLTDVVMPDMNGVELYRETKRISPKLITFLMTAYAADDVIQEGLAEGIRTVLTKPVDINLLLSLLSAVEQAYLRR